MVLDTAQLFESPIHLSPLPSDTIQNVTFIGTNLSDLWKIHGKKNKNNKFLEILEKFGKVHIYLFIFIF